MNRDIREERGEVLFSEGIFFSYRVFQGFQGFRVSGFQGFRNFQIIVMKKDKPIECAQKTHHSPKVQNTVSHSFKVVTMIMVKATGNRESGSLKQLRAKSRQGR